VSSQEEIRPAGSLQLGVQKYLYTGYFVAGCLVAYIGHHVALKFLGDGRDTLATALGMLAGLIFVVLGWRADGLRTWAQETVDELAAVTWPSRQETYSATVVVLVTSIIATSVIFLLDQFWNYFTERVLQ